MEPKCVNPFRGENVFLKQIKPKSISLINNLVIQPTHKLTKMKNLIILLVCSISFFIVIPSIAQSPSNPASKEEIQEAKKALKEEKQRVKEEKAESKALAKEQKQKLAQETAETKRVKDLGKAQKNYDKALAKKHKTEIKLAKQNLKYEQAKQKRKSGVDLAKMELAIKKTEIEIINQEGRVANFQRDIDRHTIIN